MRNENEKGDKKDGEKTDGDNLDDTDSNVGEECGDDERKNHKSQSCEECPNIDEQ